ncbi:MAG TPA: SIMPL domain-containing protein [Oculatellaceae cyanobacterium]
MPMTVAYNQSGLHPDQLTIWETFVENVAATAATLSLTVKGSSFITGDTALKKAKEVATLIEALKQSGLPEEKISLESIRLQAASGPVLKSSAAAYTLRLDCNDLEKLTDILAVVTGAKNVTLDSLDWRYGDICERKTKWIARALDQANTRAREAADVLGVKIEGVYDCEFDYINLHEYGRRIDAHPAAMEMMRSRQSFSIGMPMQQSEEKGIRVKVVYRISNPQ